jgi:hypothetical protein
MILQEMMRGCEEIDMELLSSSRSPYKSLCGTSVSPRITDFYSFRAVVNVPCLMQEAKSAPIVNVFHLGTLVSWWCRRDSDSMITELSCWTKKIRRLRFI